jgi:AraC family transcriptional regulator
MNPPVSASQFANLLPAPPDVSAAWNTFALQRLTAPLHLQTTFADHVLGLHVAGAHRLRHVFGGRVNEGRSEPGALHVIPAHGDLTVDASASSRAVALFIPEAFVSRVIAEHWEADPRRVEIARQFLIRDRLVESVMSDLEVEAREGSPSGQLYAQSACEFLAHHIIYSYSTLSRQPRRAFGGLPGRRLRLVIDYMHDRLAHPISLQQLAQLVGVSARHFERAFRQAVGIPPHRYLTGIRVEAAQQLLANEPVLTVEEIARRVGFGSSSHLATAFRRRTGHSPTAFRASCRPQRRRTRS